MAPNLAHLQALDILITLGLTRNKILAPLNYTSTRTLAREKHVKVDFAAVLFTRV